MAKANNNGEGGAAKPTRTRAANRPSHVIAAEKIGGMGIDDTNAFIEELVNTRPAAAQYLQLQLNNRLGNNNG